MPILEPERISIQEAALILQCSKERLEFYLNKELLTAYVRTPRCLPAPPSYGDILENEFCVPLALGYLINQQLDDLCQIKPPISWQDNGRVECSTIIVFTMNGSLPIASDLKISAGDVRVEPDGVIFSRIPWVFQGNKIELKTEDVNRFTKEHGREVATGRRVKRHRSTSIESRDDALGKTLHETMKKFQEQHGRLPTAHEVLSCLRKILRENKDHPVIQEIARNQTVLWRRGNGKEEKTTYTALQKRLSRIRKILKNIPLSLEGNPAKT